MPFGLGGVPFTGAGTTQFAVPNVTVATAPGITGKFPFACGGGLGGISPFGFGGVPATKFGQTQFAVPNVAKFTAPGFGGFPF